MPKKIGLKSRIYDKTTVDKILFPLNNTQVWEFSRDQKHRNPRRSQENEGVLCVPDVLNAKGEEGHYCGRPNATVKQLRTRRNQENLHTYMVTLVTACMHNRTCSYIDRKSRYKHDNWQKYRIPILKCSCTHAQLPPFFSADYPSPTECVGGWAGCCPTTCCWFTGLLQQLELKPHNGGL